MGRQIRFFMTQADEDMFVSFLRSDPNVILLCEVAPTALPEKLEVLLPLGTSGARIGFHMWNREVCSPVTTRFVSNQIGFSVDQISSDVIEFTRSRVTCDKYSYGRLWVQMTWWDDQDPPVLHHKSAKFENWFNQLVRWTRKHAAGRYEGAYVFPDAKRLRGW